MSEKQIQLLLGSTFLQSVSELDRDAALVIGPAVSAVLAALAILPL